MMVRRINQEVMATSNDKTIHNLPAIKNRWRVTMRRVILTKRTLYCAGGGCLVGDSSFRSCLVSSSGLVVSCLVWALAWSSSWLWLWLWLSSSTVLLHQLEWLADGAYKLKSRKEQKKVIIGSLCKEQNGHLMFIKNNIRRYVGHIGTINKNLIW
jgi:hypothetical protein